jgi:hypothetical protein
VASTSNWTGNPHPGLLSGSEDGPGEEKEMSTQIDGAKAARAPRAVRIALAAATGLALLTIGLGVGPTEGRPQPGPAVRAASASPLSLAPLAEAVPTLSWKDDYGTRHHVTPVPDGMGGWHDYLGTPATSKTPALSWKDDYGTRHHVIPVQDEAGGWHDFLGTRRIR